MKKKEVIRKHVNIKPEVPYVIPQIPDNTVGLRIGKHKFVKTEAVSPMQGKFAKDVTVVPEQEYHDDIDIAYDPFRVNKRLTETDEINRYGRKYHEFRSVDEQLDIDVNEEEYEQQEEQTSGIGINFGVVEDVDLHITNVVPKPETINLGSNNVSIHFGETNVNQEPQNIDFTPINVDNEIVEEQNDFMVKPTPRIVGVNSQNDVDTSIPKTIIVERPRIQTEELDEEDELPSINVPPFMNQKPTVAEEVIYDSPEVEKEESIYDTLRKNEEGRIVIPDKYANYKYPPLSLLDPINTDEIVEPDWIQEKIEAINETLEHFGVEGYVLNHTYGPTVTRYEVKLKAGVNVKKISNIEDNIKMSLCAKSLRIEAPIPGKSTVGIEVPNPEVRKVQFAELADRSDFMNNPDLSSIALGININGDPVYTSVLKMPHGLIAGTTGSGKSVCLNGILVSLLLRNTPSDLRLILVDPKIVEFSDYADLPHLATPVITDVKLASEALKWATEEMDRRFKVFNAVHVRDLKTYNAKIVNDPNHRKMPRLVVVIEEFADLILTCGNDVETAVQRITQLGRAAGIHLILATQRPTTDIVKGSIKTNIQCRIAFRVVDHVASTTILGNAGAEELLGKGDMLFKVEDAPIRMQAAFIDDGEIARVCDYIRTNYPPDYLFTHEDLQEKVKESYEGAKENTEDINLVRKIALFVIERGSCSINSIQNTFSLGFNRAQNIVDILEKKGVVGPGKGTTGREILITSAEVNEKIK